MTASVALEPKPAYGGTVLHDGIIMEKILLLRGQRVMLDRDLAELYGVRSIRLREQVKRNKSRFPGTFMFQLTDKELRDMVSQNAIPSFSHTGGALPYAFTEHGVLMLANVLKSERAVAMSIRIIEVFVHMRGMIMAHKDILLKLEQMERRVEEHDDSIGTLFQYLKELLNPPVAPRPAIGYKRQQP
ncbi:MAG: ORF6N domain-containing protein [Flavobacteriales bacterium]|nr:MAG: ORF6N domain-containing protein [Flavobacteriales bacterium]